MMGVMFSRLLLVRQLLLVQGTSFDSTIPFSGPCLIVSGIDVTNAKLLLEVYSRFVQ